MPHVLARLSGHGVSLVPYWPYRFERGEAGPTPVLVTRWTKEGTLSAWVDPANAAGLTGIAGVVDVAAGPEIRQWTVETSSYSCLWVDGFTLESPEDEQSTVPFQLCQGDMTIYAQGPVPAERLSTVEALIGRGRTLVRHYELDGGLTVAEMEYLVDEDVWWQGRWVVPLGEGRAVLVTAQAPADAADAAVEAAQAVAQSVKPLGV